MTKEVFLTVLRQVLMTVGSFVATKFSIDGDTLTAVIGGVVALVGVIWGLVSKTKSVATVAAAQTVLETAQTPVSNQQIATAAATIQK